MLVALSRWRKLLQHLSTKDGEQMFCQVFDTDSDKKVHALHYGLNWNPKQRNETTETTETKSPKQAKRAKINEKV